MHITFDEFIKYYRPIKNPFNSSASINGYMFESYGDELVFVQLIDDRHIWSVIDEDGITYICPGYHIVNRLGYIITLSPCVIDVEVDLD